MPWLVAKTKSNREIWAAENLWRQRFNYYLPRIARERRGRGGVRYLVPEPLFRGFIFVEKTISWHPISSTFGIVCIIKQGQCPALVPDSELDKIKRLEDSEGYVRLPNYRFKAGQQVRVLDGPYTGFVGLWQGSLPKERERILLDFLGRKTKVLIDSSLLEADV